MRLSALVAVMVALPSSWPALAASGAGAGNPGTPVVADDTVKPGGGHWDPDGDELSRQVFSVFDFERIPPHAKPAFERLKPSDRPPHFHVFLVSWLVAVPLFVVFSLWHFRRSRRSGASPPAASDAGVPDDLVPILVAIGLGAVVRLVAAALLPLHGSEWGTVEHKPFSAIPDIAFSGYEVLTNPPLLNLVEHFVFLVCHHPFCFRLPIVLAGVWMIWSSRTSARLMFGRRAGILAAFLVALHPGLVIWSATMRAYLPMAAFLVAAIPPAFRLARGDDRDGDAVRLAIFCALAVWTHYIAWIWLALLGAVMLATLVLHPRRLLKPAISALFVLVSFLPLVPFFFFDFGSKQGSMLPESWAVDTVALLSGMPHVSGIAVVAIIVAGRFWRSRPATALAAAISGYVGLCLATSPFIFWEVSYSVGVAAPVMILLAGCIDRMRFARVGTAVVLAGFLAASIIVAREPSDSPVMARVSRPYLWRSASVEEFSRIISSGKQPASTRPATVLVTPAFEAESFLYHLGPATASEAGVEPVIVRNFDRMSFSGPKGWYHVIGFERYWSWRLGQWPELSRFLRSSGSFWYARMQANCATGQGMTWSAWDCEWLSRHCRLVERNASDELYLCGPERGP